MCKFNNGDGIENSSLYVIDYVSESRVQCGCSVCNEKSNEYVSMVYNESDLKKGGVECRLCKEISKAKENGVFEDKRKFFDILLESSSKDVLTARVGDICAITNESDLDIPNFTEKFPLREQYDELVSSAYITKIKKKNEYGISYATPHKLVLSCEHCGFVEFVSPKSKEKKNQHRCPLCHKLRESKLKLDEQRKENERLRDIEKSKTREFNVIRTEFSKVETNKTLKKNIESLESKNKGYKVVDITKDGGATTYHLVCEKCGTIKTCMRANANLGDCKFCETRTEGKVGYLHKNYIGSVFNGLKVVSQNGLECDLECTKCGKIGSNVSLSGVLQKRYYCDCSRSKISIECPYCYAPLRDLTYKEVYSGIMPKCNSCGKDIDESEYLIAIDGMDYTNSLRSKLAIANRGISEKANKSIRFGNKFAVESLIVEKEPVYKGNDEKSYYRCFCKKHNVGLTLSEDEIQNYDCEYCNDLRQSIIANPDADSIKLV